MNNIEYVFDEHSLNYRQSLSNDLEIFDRFVGVKTDYLEVGVYQGGSGCLFLEKVLTHEKSTYTGIDDNLRQVAWDNLSRYKSKVTLYHDESKVVLPRIRSEDKKYDIIYIDGCHNVDYTLSDLGHAMNLCRLNGVILIDDYEHSEYGLKKPIDDCIASRVNTFRVILQKYRIAIKKIKGK